MDTNIPPSDAEESSGPDGPAPSIRFFTLEPCAEFGCRSDYNLVRQADGTISCKVSLGLGVWVATSGA